MTPLKEMTSIQVILDLDDDCHADIEYIDSAAALYGFKASYLLVNRRWKPIRQCVLRDDMTLINNRIDFRGARLRSDAAAAFILCESDMLIVASRSRCKVIEAITGQSRSKFKAGRHHLTGNEIFDLAVRVIGQQQERNLARTIVSAYKVLTNESTAEE